VRASAGSIFHVPFAVCDANTAIAKMRALNIKIFAADAGGAPVFETDFCAPSAIIIGNEAGGISSAMLATADAKVGIPVASESLNAAVACGIMAYEAVRQRRYSQRHLNQ